MPPPSSGGAVILQILNVLQAKRKKLGKLFSRTIEYHILAEAMKHAYADRAAYLSDPDFSPTVRKICPTNDF